MSPYTSGPIGVPSRTRLRERFRPPGTHLGRRLHVRRKDLNPDDAHVQGLTAVDHDEEVMWREVTDRCGVEAGSLSSP